MFLSDGYVLICGVLIFTPSKQFQNERDRLLAEVESLASPDGHAHKLPDIHLQKLKSLEAQVG